MDINGLSVPDAVIKGLRDHYKDLVTKAGQATAVYGRESEQYALALALMTATVTAVQFAYGYKTAHDAHVFLGCLRGT